MIRLLPTVVLTCTLAASLTAAQRPAPAPVPAPADVAKPPADATKSATGLASKVLTPGKGATKPGPADIVTVHYSGWTTDGKMFDSSLSGPTPATFPLNRLIKGWGEGLQLMVAGEKRRFWIPQELAYGGQPGRPAGMLVFDVELIEFMPSPSTPPPDVAKAPAYKSLRAGQGGATPKRSSTVTVHYTGWTTDGKMFDTSLDKGAPISFRLDAVIEGWTEGVQLMTVGEKVRFWIPEDMAYKGERPPRGLLVFDVELIAIK
jgi:FKBP-type peptidyl-prolyl cis-trans isomerase